MKVKAKMKAFLARFHRSSGSRISTPEKNAHDVFAGLPFELHVLIIAHLEPGDIDAALGASRVLRLIWLSDEIWPALADRWFPGLAQQIRLADIDEPARCELFRRSLHRVSRRTAGKFAAAMHYGFGLASDEFFQLSKDVPISEGGVHSYESVENLDIDDAQRFSRFMMYSNGRVAWWPEGYGMPYLAVVDDLRTRARRVYLFPNHGESIRGYKTAMGKKLFVMGHDTKLHVWHLELNRLESFEVPENFKRCITEGERILVVSQSSDIYIWKFGEKLQHIDMHKLSCYPREYVVSGGPPVWTPRIWLSSQQGLHLRNSQLLIDFILSPNTDRVFFVITLALDESGRLTVYEIHDGEIAATYVMEDRIYSDPRTTERGLLSWEKLNSFGGYCLVQVIQEPSTTNGNAHQDHEACPCGRKSRQLVSLCFNIYTKLFTTLRHHLSELSPWISHVWNDRLFIMDDQFHRRQTASNRRPVMSLAPCSEVDTPREKAASVPMYTTMHENTPLVYRRRRVPFDIGDMGDKLNMELGLDVLQEFSPCPTWNDSFIPCPSEINPGKLVGDDEFFIFINSPSYTVLSFGEGFPITHLTVNRRKSWWRKSRGKDCLR
ncbi:hypothetical protein E0Z10_g4182 [Xylaria hypoxylon]|uniref:F-box domain-containing protein n=1 Tax=Xylaria hypoxylon TaxID=37992 RepID=A0A4Z0YJT8_9PEZI|nr:hypothetical protein E0Z10_g4182 [Xylaria hypoxylon]